MFGFINIYKPKGYTSFDVVACLRKITGIKQIGHSGTLDPFAQGVLPIAIGKASKLIEYLPSYKTYTATIQFGANTDTYDLEGEITQKFDNKISKEDVEKIIKNFEGEIEQIPPMYSAIKVNGKKLYEYARKNQQIEIKPRKVIINKIHLIDFNFELQQCRIKVSCEKGVYIRSIAYDIGKILNCGGYLIELIRENVGQFSIDNSIELKKLQTKQDVENNLIDPIKIINFPSIKLTEQEMTRVSHGLFIKNKKNPPNNVVFLVYNDKIYAVGLTEEEKIIVKKVFGL